MSGSVFSYFNRVKMSEKSWSIIPNRSNFKNVTGYEKKALVLKIKPQSQLKSSQTGHLIGLLKTKLTVKKRNNTRYEKRIVHKRILTLERGIFTKEKDSKVNDSK